MKHALLSRGRGEQEGLLQNGEGLVSRLVEGASTRTPPACWSRSDIYLKTEAEVAKWLRRGEEGTVNRMKRRIIHAAALAGCSAVSAEPATGGTGPQHLRRDGAAGRRRGPGRRRLPRSEAAWWHGKKSSENDSGAGVSYTHVGSVALGSGSTAGPGSIKANSAAADDGDGDKDEGRGALHALYNSGPDLGEDLSDAAKFASGSSSAPVNEGEKDMVSNSSPVLANTLSNGSSSGTASWLVYFPVWDEDVEGGRCESSSDYAHLPDSYIDLDEYMFRSRGECCEHWFGKDESDLAGCYGEGEEGEMDEMAAAGGGTEVDGVLSLEDIFDDDDEAAAEEAVVGMSAAAESPAPTYEPTDAPTDSPTVSFINISSISLSS